MNIYIEHEGKFYKYGLPWGNIKNYPNLPYLFNPDTHIDNPQFAPGDRVWFEDLEGWTEVFDKGLCDNCVFSEFDENTPCPNVKCKGSERDDGKSICFRELTETTELEKSPDQATPVAILDNERNRIACEMMKSLVSSTAPLDGGNTPKNYASASFAYADAFIARAKRASG